MSYSLKDIMAEPSPEFVRHESISSKSDTTHNYATTPASSVGSPRPSLANVSVASDFDALLMSKPGSLPLPSLNQALPPTAGPTGHVVHNLSHATLSHHNLSQVGSKLPSVRVVSATVAQSASAPSPESVTRARSDSSSSEDSGPITCKWTGCDKMYNSVESLYQHLCDDHIGRKVNRNLQLTCQWDGCGTTTVKRDHITSHVRVHIPLKPYACSTCPKKFKRPQDLKKHIKVHMENRPRKKRGPNKVQKTDFMTQFDSLRRFHPQYNRNVASQLESFDSMLGQNVDFLPPVSVFKNHHELRDASGFFNQLATSMDRYSQPPAGYSGQSYPVLPSYPVSQHMGYPAVPQYALPPLQQRFEPRYSVGTNQRSAGDDLADQLEQLSVEDMEDHRVLVNCIRDYLNALVEELGDEDHEEDRKLEKYPAVVAF